MIFPVTEHFTHEPIRCTTDERCLITAKTSTLCHRPTKFGDFRFKDLTRLRHRPAATWYEPSSVVARLSAMVNCQCEVLLLSPSDNQADPNMLLDRPANGQAWRCMIRHEKMQVNDQLPLVSPKDDTGFKTALRIAKIHGSWLEEGEDDGVEADVVIEVGSEGDFAGSTSMDTVLQAFGSVPIPPYLNRDAVATDDTTNQTVYADKQGSDASPTAGLHISDAMMNELRSGEYAVDVTLHGATFTVITLLMTTRCIVRHSK